MYGVDKKEDWKKRLEIRRNSNSFFISIKGQVLMDYIAMVEKAREEL